MKTWTFFITLLAINIVVHLMRLPHLIIDNGGGAFIILFLLVTHVVAFPVVLAEIALSRSRLKISLKDILMLKKASGKYGVSRFLIRLFTVGQLVLLFFLAVFFLYMVGMSLLHVVHYGILSLEVNVTQFDIKNYPPLGASLGVMIVILFLSFIFSKKGFSRFIEYSSRWVLPFCFSVILLVLSRILFSLTDYSGLKVLFYPDFSQLKISSLFLALGQSVLALFVGTGFYNQSAFIDTNKDPIRIVIRCLIQVVIISLLVAMMALPSLQQAGESAFGSSWIFTVLPRWLSYGQYGAYYCFLFYISMTYIFFYLVVQLMNHSYGLLQSLFSQKNLPLKWFVLFFMVIVGGLITFYNQPLRNWWSQGVYYNFDFWIVNVLLPFCGLGVLWMMFAQTTKEDRQSVFKHQQVFFHNTYFFRTWEWGIKYIIPPVIILTWLYLIL